MSQTSERDVNPAAEKPGIDFHRTPVRRAEHVEGSFTRIVEEQTARIPSDIFLIAAIGAMGLSMILEISNQVRASRFVGQWPAPLLIMGVYNKIVKTVGAG